ncbi:MAG: type 2 isopentenyl-diphosphate Delta-isomerase [Micropruina sp.]|uniref:type 2 isopentenyl-diphosphate Delta-isomerase n=1 Tax=Micropruina sp. TaxID=2737536 RepID=UPI0039E30E23
MTTDPSLQHRLRKDDHIVLAERQQQSPVGRNDFDDVEFLHHALDGIDETGVRLGVRVGEVSWPVPLYINGMTGGSDTATRINRELAITARETGLAMACGSMSIALRHPDTAAGFRVLREENPDGFIMANLGAGRSGEDARRAVELIGADALQIHLNAAQETVMPEGERAFTGWAASVEQMVAAAGVPVIVKEVGFGLSRRTLLRLRDLGVRIADVSGAGGTDFVGIENARRRLGDFAFLGGYGQSAIACLLDAPHGTGPDLLASGGVRSPLDVVKALALGARAAGVAGVFLKPASEGGAEALVPIVRRWLAQLRQLHALLGAAEPAELQRTDLLLRGRVKEFCELRGIDPGSFTRRRDAASPPSPGVPTPDVPTRSGEPNER